MQAILIAAGRSSRFWPLNHEHKSTFPLAGKPLLLWTLESLAKEGGIEEAIVVHGADSIIPSLVPEVVEGMKVRFALQKDPIGTGNALYQARPFVQGKFALVWPDMVNAGSLVARMAQEAKRQGVDGVLVGAQTQTPWIFGIIESENGRVSRVVEKPQRGMEKSRVKRVGIELFGEDFFSFYDALAAHHEADLVDAINEYAAVRSVALLEQEDVAVLKYPWDVFVALDILASKGTVLSVQSGAQVEEGAIVEGDVYVAPGARICAGASVIGPASIGENVIVGPDSVIQHSVVGNGTTIQGATIPHSIIGANCSLGTGVSVSSVSATSTSVYSTVKGEIIDTGRDSLGAIIGDNTTIEPRATLAAGVLVGSDVFIGAGVSVIENIEDGREVTARGDDEETE